jgi:hypothetical protein
MMEPQGPDLPFYHTQLENDKFCETAIFRHWTEAAQGCDSWEKKNKQGKPFFVVTYTAVLSDLPKM